MGFWQKLKKIYMGDVFGSAISEADRSEERRVGKECM